MRILSTSAPPRPLTTGVLSAFASDETFIGAATTLREPCDRAALAAESDVPVFLWGAPGVGKETFARRIAAASERAAEPFVPIRCDRIPANRVDALFSIRRENGVSSFGVAPDVAAEVGSGTLFLTNVDALPFNVQRRLAALLNAAPFDSPSPLSFRVLLGSSRDFPSARRAGAFAPELESILTSYPIFIPPLRDRRADLPALVEFFSLDAARRFGIWPRPMSKPALDALRNADFDADFPENLRDLQRYLENATRTGDFSLQKRSNAAASDADAASRPAPNRRSRRQTAEPSTSPGTVERATPTRENFLSLDEAAREHTIAALRLTNGVVDGPNGAAALLKINPHTLRSRMEKLGVDWKTFRADADL